MRDGNRIDSCLCGPFEECMTAAEFNDLFAR